MSDILELQVELLKLGRWLETKLSEQKPLSEAYGQAEHDYRVALASEMAKKRLEGLPVTLIPDMCRGDKHVANLKMKRDIAKGVSDACRDSIKSLWANISALQTLMSVKKEEMKIL